MIKEILQHAFSVLEAKKTKLKRSANKLLAVTALLMCTISGAFAQFLVDQSVTNTGTGWAVNTGTIAQSFTSGYTSNLRQLVINIDNTNGVYPVLAGDFTVTVRSGNGYGGTILGVDTFTITTGVGNGEFIIPINADVTLVEGNVYTYIIDEISGTGQILLRASGSDVYAGGNLYNNGSSFTGYDFYFKTYVDCINTTSSINVNGLCNYISPSGKYNWESSGVFLDTIQNSIGCDSVITVNLTLGYPVSQALTLSTETVCDSGSVNVSIDTSLVGFSYYLKDNNNDSIVDGPIEGDGSSVSLSTGAINNASEFQIYAESDYLKPYTSNALRFTGNDSLKKVSLGTTIWNDEFAGGNQLTVEAWIKRSATGSLHTIMSNYQTGYPFLLRIDDDRIRLFINSSPLVTGTTILTTNTWYHVAGVYDGTQIHVYVNGVLENSANVSGTLITSSNEMKIGGGLANNSEFFPGDIAEVRIWNIARTTEQIAENYNKQLSASDSGLVIYYQFNEEAGDTAYNSALNGAYSGLLINNPRRVDGPSINSTETCVMEFDSPINIDFFTTTTSSFDTTVCLNYISPSGKAFTSSTTIVDTIPNANSCDSIITINLTVELNLNVTLNGGELTASADGATYQWIDCNDNNATITDQTSKTFSPLVSGNYAVIVSKNGCVDTSACVEVVISGISDQNMVAIQVFPNPTSGKVNITLNQELKNAMVVVSNMIGQEVVRKSFNNTNSFDISLNEQNDGVYFIRIFNENNVIATKKVVKQ